MIFPLDSPCVFKNNVINCTKLKDRCGEEGSDRSYRTVEERGDITRDGDMEAIKVQMTQG